VASADNDLQHTFLKSCWYVAGWSSDLPANQLLACTIADESIVAYRKRDGSMAALEDRCCHRFAPLSLGRLEGDDLRCMYHGLKYHSSGACIEIPGQKVVSRKMRVKSYPVLEKHGWIWIWIWMGDPALADPSLVPAAVGPEDPAWTLRCGQMDYQSNCLLINDNLTDFTHLAYVHAKSFGTSEEFARTRPTVTEIPRGIRVQRWVLQPIVDDLSIQVPDGAVRGNELWQSYDFVAPGILLMYNATYPPGTAERNERHAPGPESGVPTSTSFTSQAVTPLTATTSRYFFSWGPRTEPGSDAVAERMFQVALEAFGEDKRMIEAQQRNIDKDPNRRELLTSADAGPVLMRKVIDRLIKQEREAQGACSTVKIGF
jgi:phenylpropionate dioxygenase-like ring-hydroxylating dioxygenase large terminal subunit